MKYNYISIIMEIKIVITKKNKEKILALVDQLVECEAEGTTTETITGTDFKSLESYQSPNFVKDLSNLENTKLAEPEIRQSKFGAWGMFNSFVPGKASLRVLINLVSRRNGEPVKFLEMVDECVTYFSKSGLCKYRGFPKKTSESAKGRLVTHLILPYDGIGLMKIEGSGKDSLVMITKEGLSFVKLQNPLLDGSDKTKSLSEEECEWLVSHLKRIDDLGYKEFSILESLTRFLSGADRKFEDIVGWFKGNEDFVAWLQAGSRYEHDPKAFLQQLDNVARTFASGKIALLRELGILSNKRATYKVIHRLEITPGKEG